MHGQLTKEKDKKYQKPVKSFTENEGGEGTGPMEGGAAEDY